MEQTKNKILIDGLKDISNSLHKLASTVTDSKNKISENADLLNLLSPIDNAIRKSISKASYKSKSIPKQSEIR